MAKRLTMAEIDTILTLHKAGHSNREIAALVGVNRETVGRQLARAKAAIQPNAPTGNPSDDPNPDQPNAPTGSASLSASGPRSKCEAFREEILEETAHGQARLLSVAGRSSVATDPSWAMWRAPSRF